MGLFCRFVFWYGGGVNQEAGADCDYFSREIYKSPSVIKSVILSPGDFFYLLGGFVKNFFFLCGFKITPIKNLIFLIILKISIV